VLLVLRAGLLPEPWAVTIGSIVLLASAYGFSQTAAKVKTSDYFFTGFPSYWNLVVFYMFLFRFPAEINALILLAFAVLVFVPLRYVYPSRTTTLSGLTNVLGILWGLLAIFLVWRLPATDGPWAWLSMVFPIYYFVLSGYLDLRSRRRV
jgi:phosphatidylcholine synthase